MDINLFEKFKSEYKQLLTTHKTNINKINPIKTYNNNNHKKK
jgi:hypothetical protein